MAAASGLDKFRFMDEIGAKLDSADGNGSKNNPGGGGGPGGDPVHVNGNSDNGHEGRNGSTPDPMTDSPDIEAAAAASLAASRLFSLHRELANNSMTSPADILRHLEASARSNRSGCVLPGIDRLASLAGFGFPGLAGLPALTPLSSMDKDLNNLPPGLKQALTAEQNSKDDSIPREEAAPSGNADIPEGRSPSPSLNRDSSIGKFAFPSSPPIARLAMFCHT